jgi:TPP-dependent pyruvate/acetoin dehydrogenase alpha subunit
MVKEAKLLEMYRVMLRIRLFDERVKKEFAAGKIPGFVHLYSGEEAVAVGACSNLRADDYITSTHRGHGHLIAKGGKMDRMMAELYGKKTGYCKGKGGSMHIAEIELGILGANGIVGAGITIAVGAALSAKMRGTDQVTICFFGDGASNRGTFHEGINLAACWDLPAVFIIENNQFGEYTRNTDACKVPNLADRAKAYGIPGVIVDGNDVLTVYEAVADAVKRARKGEGPTLIECKTWRHHGHFEGDTKTYMSKEEAAEWMKKDPILLFKLKLLKMGVMTDEIADKINQEIANEIEKSVQFAEESEYPDAEEVLNDVYALGE